MAHPGIKGNTAHPAAVPLAKRDNLNSIKQQQIPLAGHQPHAITEPGQAKLSSAQLSQLLDHDRRPLARLLYSPTSAGTLDKYAMQSADAKFPSTR